jgi:ABC-type oligopeptide transport system substrate-binding subunit
LKKIQKKTNWTSNTFNRLIRSTRYFTKTQQQQKAYKTAYRQADKILCQDEVAVLPIFHQISPVLIKPKVQGWEQATIGGQQLEQCSFKKYSY